MRNVPSIHIRRSLGFTLIELMIVVVIIGTLAAIAYPSYIEFVKRGHETEAKGQIMDLASKMEALRAKNFNYAGATISALAPELDGSDHYTAGLVLGNGNQSYTITATPSSSVMAGMDILTYTSAGEASWE